MTETPGITRGFSCRGASISRATRGYGGVERRTHARPAPPAPIAGSSPQNRVPIGLNAITTPSMPRRMR